MSETKSTESQFVPLKVPVTLELVEQLKELVRDFAGREQKLEHDHTLRTTTEREQFAAATEEENARLAAETADHEAARAAACAQLQAKRDRRNNWITKALKSTKKLGLERIDVDEGRKRYEVQKGVMETHRKRDADLINNDNTLATFQAQCAENRNQFVLLEQRAQEAFGGYRKFRRTLEQAAAEVKADLTRDEYQLFDELERSRAKTDDDLKQFGGLVFPAVYRLLPAWLLAIFVLGAAFAFKPVMNFFKAEMPLTDLQVGLCAGGLLALIIGGYLHGLKKGLPRAQTIARALENARQMYNACLEKCVARHASEIARIHNEFNTRTKMLDEQWSQAQDEAYRLRNTWPKQIDEKAGAAFNHNNRHSAAQLAAIESHFAHLRQQIQAASQARREQMTGAHQAHLEKFNADYQSRWQALETDWRNRVQPLWDTVRAQNELAARSFPPWETAAWQSWRPPAEFVSAVKFGALEIDLDGLSQAVPKSPRLALPQGSQFPVPLWLTYPECGSILFETAKSGSEDIAHVLNNIILRLFAKSPAGKLSVTIIDPVKLGQSFAGIMHLADYEEHLINSRIWTQASEIEERLASLNEHMEKVIQMYLRNEYATIAEYNAQAGTIAEKYHLLVVADFPANFSDTAAKRLLKIAAAGARCGVYTLIHWDQRLSLPQDFAPEDLRKYSVCLTNGGAKDFVLTGRFFRGSRVALDLPPDPAFMTEFLHQVGQCNKDSNRVEVPFKQVAPPADEVWSHDTTSELRVPIGRSGATKLQYLAIGKGTRQHALLAGKTGSGKSTLFHVMITNLAMWCSPDHVEFYLVDFKKGVEFKCYASTRLPHAKVVAIESDREFGLSVLQRVDDELRRRGDIFRQMGVQDIAGYKREGGKDPMPRCLLMIDEFQEFFVEDDRVSQNAAVLMDRIVRQGRAFGIHVLLGSQTLGGAYTLARTTMGQMVIRIALQCNEADAYLIMDDNNPAPRLLSRPGEGIYNDSAGTIEGNSPFQTVWLSDQEREVYLEKARELADQMPNAALYPGPIVFEGNAPSEVRENLVLKALLQADRLGKAPVAPHVWLGAPNAIKGPTEAVFHRQSGNNLLMVGQRDEAALAILAVSLVSLAAQYPAGGVKILLLDSAPPGTMPREFIDKVVAAIPHPIVQIKPNELGAVMTGLVDEMKQRSTQEAGGDSVPTFLFIHGIQNIKKLRQDDDFGFSMGGSESEANPAALLGQLITEGPSLGMHVFVACDTFNNVNRFLGRKALSEFEMRVLFQMSANDSASLIDNPKASTLGLHRALFYNEQEGYLETFRPYALPGSAWLEFVTANLTRLCGKIDLVDQAK